jgi:alcohol dehydrogenase
MLHGIIAAGDAEKLQSYWRNSTFAEKVLVPLENVYPIPESLLERYSPARLTELNTSLVGYGGLLAGNLEPGQSVMIQPATGHFGAAAVAVAVAMGASAVYAVGRNTSVLNTLVEKLGKRVKPVVIKGAETDKDVYGKLQVDMTLNLYPPGSLVENVIYGFPALKAGGTLVLMGGIQEAVAIPYGELMFKCITVKGNFMFPQSAVPKIIALAEAGLLDLDVFEEKSFKLGDVAEAVEFSASQENRGWLYSTVLEPSTA